MNKVELSSYLVQPISPFFLPWNWMASWVPEVFVLFPVSNAINRNKLSMPITMNFSLSRFLLPLINFFVFPPSSPFFLLFIQTAGKEHNTNTGSSFSLIYARKEISFNVYDVLSDTSCLKHFSFELTFSKNVENLWCYFNLLLQHIKIPRQFFFANYQGCEVALCDQSV